MLKCWAWRGSINALSRATPAEPTTLEELVQIVKLRRLRDLRKEMANSIEQLNRARIAILRRLALLEERLALAQAHSQITSFDEAKELARDPRTTALREIVTRLVEDSVRLGNQAASLTSSELRARRNLLEMQADRTFLRSNLRAGDIELLGIDGESGVPPDTPCRACRSGSALGGSKGGALTALSERAEHRLSAIAEVRRQLADQDALLPVSSSDLAAQIDDLSSIGDQLRTLANDQEAEIGRLEATIAGLRKNFVDRVRTVQAQALFPTAFASCQRRSMGARAQRRCTSAGENRGRVQTRRRADHRSRQEFDAAAIGRRGPRGGGSRARRTMGENERCDASPSMLALWCRWRRRSETIS